MTATIIDGKAIAAQLRLEVKEELQLAREKYGRAPGLAVILLGQDPASTIYVKNKRAACAEVNIDSYPFLLPYNTTQDHLLRLIDTLNHDEKVDGILLQLPLPAHLDAYLLSEAILPYKDVDGFHPYNMGRLAQRQPLLRPCTPWGVIYLLEHIDCDLSKADAVVVGSSTSVGRPMALELLLAGATVSICHSGTRDLAKYLHDADVIVSAVGKPGLILGSWVKPGAVVIDIGITRLASGELAGDVEFAAAAERASFITPVPGGVGPMTVAMLLKNTVLAMRSPYQE